MNLRVAVVVETFPVPSQTFVINHIVELLLRGVDLDIFAVKRPAVEVRHQDIARYDLLARTHYSRMPQRRDRRALGAVRRLVSSPPRLRRSLLTSLDPRSAGSRALSLRPFYDVLLFGGRRFDVIHCHFGMNGQRAVAAREAGAVSGAVVTTFHGFDVNVDRWSKGYGHLFRAGDLFTANTQFTADRATELGCPPDRIEILPMSVRTAECQFRERRRSPGEPLRVLSVARLVEKKGLEYGIRAIGHVARAGIDVEYTVVGDGPLRNHLRDVAAQLGIAERVHFLGWRTQEELAGIYDTAHLFMLPSVTAANGDREGQGLVLQEAQAQGLPVISTLHNGIPEGVLDGVSAVLVRERDATALGGALQALALDPDRWIEMGRAGRRFVEERYDPTTLTNRLMEVYRRALNEYRPDHGRSGDNIVAE